MTRLTYWSPSIRVGPIGMPDEILSIGIHDGDESQILQIRWKLVVFLVGSRLERDSRREVIARHIFDPRVILAAPDIDQASKFRIGPKGRDRLIQIGARQAPKFRQVHA